MHNQEDIQTQIIQILKNFVPQGQELTPETDLVADLGLDSMKVMDIAAEVEDSFDISIPLNILPEISTINDFTSQIQKIIMKEGS
jgi:acyl carrier protein